MTKTINKLFAGIAIALSISSANAQTYQPNTQQFISIGFIKQAIEKEPVAANAYFIGLLEAGETILFCLNDKPIGVVAKDIAVAIKNIPDEYNHLPTHMIVAGVLRKHHPCVSA